MNKDIFKRKRNQIIIDKKRSLLNYDKLDNTNNEKKQEYIKKLQNSGLSNNDIENLKKHAIKERDLIIKKENLDLLPLPQKIINNNKEIGFPEFHSKAYLTNNFDEVEYIDSQYSLININNFISKFKEEEIKQLQLLDVFGFDANEYDRAYKKIDEMKKIAKNNKETELMEFFRSKKRVIEVQQEKIRIVQNNFDKIDDFIIFDDNMKFFFNNNSLANK